MSVEELCDHIDGCYPHGENGCFGADPSAAFWISSWEDQGTWHGRLMACVPHDGKRAELVEKKPFPGDVDAQFDLIHHEKDEGDLDTIETGPYRYPEKGDTITFRVYTTERIFTITQSQTDDPVCESVPVPD